jgi:hypothetical protein
MPGENQDFNKLEDDFVYGSLALSPVSATAAGYHEHNGKRLDEMLDDFTTVGIAEQRRFYFDLHNRMELIKPDSLDAEERADYRLIDDQINLALAEINLIRGFTHNPTIYVELTGNALFTPFVMEYAPKQQRYQHIIKRLERVPALMLQARQNLQDSPDVWTTVAQEENDGNIRLIDVTLRSSAPPELKDAYDKAAAGALEALRKFNDFLKNDLSKKTASWRLGKEKYDLKFKWTLDVGRTPEEVLADAEPSRSNMRPRQRIWTRPNAIFKRPPTT